MPDITYDVGRVSFVMKGAWNLATAYEKLDAVSYNGSLYIAKQNVPGGTAITNTTYWQLAAEKGDKGDTGGVDSVNGQQGDVWFPDSRQLISDGYTTDTDPFLMKGNDSDSDRFELAKKLGNTVAVNQQVEHGNFDAVTGWICQNGGTITASGNIGTCSFTSNTSADQLIRDISLTNGHTFLISLEVKQSSASAGLELLGGMQVPVAASTATTDWQTLRAISSGVPYSYWILRNSTSEPSLVVQLRNAFVIDLSLWFGSTANIPSDLLAHPENWGRYYAGSLDYNAGTLESADGSVLTSISRNCFDGELESGSYNPSTGAKVTNANAVRSKNLIPCIPNETYYFRSATTLPAQVFYVVFFDAQGNFVGANVNGYYNATKTIPANAHFMGFWAGSSSYPVTDTSRKFTISIYYSGESGYDEDYDDSVLAEVDTGSEQLLNWDSKAPDGTITRGTLPRIDMGTLTFVTADANGRTYCSPIPDMKKGGISGYGNFFKTNLFVGVEKSSMVQLTDGEMSVDVSGYIQICKTAWANYSTEQLATALSGIYLEAEAATPTTEQGTAFDPLVVTVKNGVLSWTNTKGIPVGQESHWFENLRKRVEDRLPDPPSADGTYRLTCTISGGVKTYSWEA